MKRANNIYFGNTPVVKVLLDSNVVWPIGSIIEPDVAKPANNEIWYTSGITTEATVPSYTGGFGANIVSNTYDAEKECWVIKFDGDVTRIGNGAFDNCKYIQTITIPDSVTKIGNYAFSTCQNLLSINIHDRITYIGEYAFSGCHSLNSVTIPDSVTMIDYRAFQYCYRLKTVTIGNNVTEIGDYCFFDCSKLTSVYCKGTNPPYINSYRVFEGVSSELKIYVPTESVEIYKTNSRWKNLADAIVGYDFL